MIDESLQSYNIPIYKGTDDNGNPYGMNDFAIHYLGVLPVFSEWSSCREVGIEGTNRNRKSKTFTGRLKKRLKSMKKNQ